MALTKKASSHIVLSTWHSMCDLLLLVMSKYYTSVSAFNHPISYSNYHLLTALFSMYSNVMQTSLPSPTAEELEAWRSVEIHQMNRPYQQVYRQRKLPQPRQAATEQPDLPTPSTSHAYFPTPVPIASTSRGLSPPSVSMFFSS